MKQTPMFFNTEMVRALLEGRKTMTRRIIKPQHLMILVGILVLALLTACANNPNRAGCTYIDGTGRFGTLTQYAKGKAQGAHIYIGENMKGVEITCSAEKQELIYNKIE